MSHPLASLLRVSSFSVTETSSLVPLITQQESLARFTSFTHETAWQLGSTIRSIFLEQHAAKVLSGESGIVVRIELWNGLEVFSCVVGDGPVVGPSNWEWVRAKSNVVRKFGKSSLRRGREIADSEKTPEEVGLHFPEYACHGGGFPIWIKDVKPSPIGAIMVSGLPQLEDHQLIIDALVKCQHLLVPVDAPQMGPS